MEKDVSMTRAMKILKERIERFGSMCAIDEYGSHDEDTIKLYSAVSDEEAKELSDLEKSKRFEAALSLELTA
jgi:hypothetical protein